MFIGKSAERCQGAAARRASCNPVIDALVGVGEDYLFAVACVLDRHHVIRALNTLYRQLA